MLNMLINKCEGLPSGQRTKPTIMTTEMVCRQRQNIERLQMEGNAFESSLGSNETRFTCIEGRMWCSEEWMNPTLSFLSIVSTISSVHYSILLSLNHVLKEEVNPKSNWW
jgi:hypothetical protein